MIQKTFYSFDYGSYNWMMSEWLGGPIRYTHCSGKVHGDQCRLKEGSETPLLEVNLKLINSSCAMGVSEDRLT